MLTPEAFGFQIRKVELSNRALGILESLMLAD
jgi:hypothetical protein